MTKIGRQFEGDDLKRSSLFEEKNIGLGYRIGRKVTLPETETPSFERNNVERECFS